MALWQVRQNLSLMSKTSMCSNPNIQLSSRSVSLLPFLAGPPDWVICMDSVYFLTPIHSHSVISQFSCSVVSDSLWPHGLQHARLPCPGVPSPTPGACSNSCPLSQWCHHPSLPLSSPCPLAFNLSQHQGLFQCPFFTSSVSWNLDFIPTTVRREH